jgi:hypothetical protein
MLSKAPAPQRPEGVLRPENSPLGSPESRASARAMLGRIQADRKKNAILVRIEHIGNEEANRTLEVYKLSRRGNR